MKKTFSKFNGVSRWSLLGALAVASGVLSLPQAARADVTLFEGNEDIPSVLAYLRVDAGVRFIGNVDSAQYKNAPGQQGDPSRVGRTTTLVQAGGNDWGTSMGGVYGTLKFDENTSGVYKIEAGWNSTNNNSWGWNRRAYAGLSDKRFGTITAGRDMSLANDYIWAIDPMVMEDFSVATLVGGRNWNSAGDQVRYTSPTWHGLTIAGQVQFGSGDTNINEGANSLQALSGGYSAYAQYQVSILTLEYLYDTVHDSNGHYSNLFTSSKESTVGAIVDLKPVTLYAGWSNLQAPDATPAVAGTGLWPIYSSTVAASGNSYTNVYGTQYQYATRENMEWGGLAWNITPKFTVRGAVYHANINDHIGNANLYTAGFEYHFAKNFFYYASVGELTNSGHTDFAADIGSPAPQPGKSQTSGFTGFSMSF